ncbi:hypothetical protein TrLO_g9764 [Triparma laevis f. longispina]|uniref:Uncharacterized protein n=1 Tax=Triparma laevis f. longispina TaxID=1714387 RepID=A0A9W7FRA3_9STRA|nr:hypothetical protein TrLO_g9764 [Triparma laevis f. longispina]
MILSASRDLSSGLTASEKHYFSQLSRYSNLTSSLSIDSNQLLTQGRDIRDMVREGRELSEAQKGMCEDLVRGEGVILRKAREGVERCRETIG